jgi:uncharacterized protein (TIGR00369 family)
VSSRREIIEQFMPSSPLFGLLGMRVDTVESDRAELTLPYRPEIATIENIVHGGAIASLIDTAGMAATWADPDVEPESVAGATVSMNVDYVAAARGKELRAVATVVRRGRSLCFTEVTVSEPDGRLVARGSVVQRFG